MHDHGTDLLGALRRRPLLFLAPVVVLAALAVAYGLAREPRYTAEARVTVGQLSVSTQGVPGFVSAASALSSAYARAVDAPAVVRTAARAAHVSRAAARDAVSASPIADTPLFRVEAETSSERESVRLANGAAGGVIAYVRGLNRRGDVRAGIRRRYARISERVQRLALARSTARRAFDRSPTTAARRALEDASGQLASAQLEQRALQNVYGGAVQGVSAANLLQLLAPATAASSDRGSVLQKAVVTGVLAGLVIGAALCLLADGRRRRRLAPTAAAPATDAPVRAA